MEKLFTGVYTAIVTPFNEDGSVDWKGFEELIERQITGGVAGIVPCGTTGESPTLSHKEHGEVIEKTVQVVGGRCQVVAGTGSNSTQEAIALTAHAQEVGADGSLQVNPYYNKPTQEGLFQHFTKIAEAVDIPIMLYNIKGRTGVNVETDTLLRILDLAPNIVSVKEASGDIQQIKDVVSKTDDSFSVLSGDDNITYNLIEAGGDGVVSVASNVYPEEIVELVQPGYKIGDRIIRPAKVKVGE